MADGHAGVTFNAQDLEDKRTLSSVSECKCCSNLKRELKELQQELSSAKLIIELLQQEDGAKEHERYGFIEPRNLIQCNDLQAEKTTNNEWIEVIPSRTRRMKQVKADTREWKVNSENRYEVLNNLQETTGSIKGPDLKKTRGVTNMSRRNPIKRNHKVLLIGDSHARDAGKISNYLGNDHEVTGYVHPSSGLEMITSSAKKEITHMTKRDVVIVCGGANNINKNESIKGLKAVTQFVQSRSNTNVIVMNAPHRSDLEETSCVNTEIKRYNRKLNDIMRRYNHSKVINMSANRDHYTTHGLHMNKAGKDWLARRIADSINKLFTNQELVPITLEWEERPEKGKYLQIPEYKENDSRIEQQEVRTSSRIRKQPEKMDTFLWSTR